LTATVKGNQIKITKEYITGIYGKDSIERLSGHIDAEYAELISQPVLDAARAPEEAFVQLLNAVHIVYGRSDYKVMREIGRYLAKQSISKFYRIFIQFGDPMFVVQRSGSFWRTIHNTGSMKFEAAGAKKARGRLYEFPFPSKAFCSMLLGYFEGVIEMSGRKAVSSCETKCMVDGTGYCEYEVEWE